MTSLALVAFCAFASAAASQYLGDFDQTLPAVNVKFDFPASAAVGVKHFGGTAALKQRVYRLLENTSSDIGELAEFLSQASGDLDRVVLLLQANSELRGTSFLQARQSPTFPGGVGDLVSNIANTMKSADKPAVDEDAVLAKLENDGKAVLEADLASEAAASEEAEAAFAAVREKVLKLIYTGGCPRDFSGCPIGWSESAGSCAPPSDYSGPCAAGPIADKEQFAWKCRASWPCSSCTRDYSGCPTGWATVDGLCTAPSDYHGDCSATMDFSPFSAKRRAELAAMCAYSFPCKSSSVAFTQKKARSSRELGADIGRAIKEVGSMSVEEEGAISPPVLVNPQVSAVVDAANARAMARQWA